MKFSRGIKRGLLVCASALVLLGVSGAVNSNINGNNASAKRIKRVSHKRVNKRIHKSKRRNVKRNTRKSRIHKNHKHYMSLQQALNKTSKLDNTLHLYKSTGHQKSYKNIKFSKHSNIYKQARWYQRNFSKLYNQNVHTTQTKGTGTTGYTVNFHFNPMFEKGTTDTASSWVLGDGFDSYIRINLRDSKNKLYQIGYIMALSGDYSNTSNDETPNLKAFEIAINQFNTGRKYAQKHHKSVVYSSVNNQTWHYSNTWKHNFNVALSLLNS